MQKLRSLWEKKCYYLFSFALVISFVGFAAGLVFDLLDGWPGVFVLSLYTFYFAWYCHYYKYFKPHSPEPFTFSVVDSQDSGLRHENHKQVPLDDDD